MKSVDHAEVERSPKRHACVSPHDTTTVSELDDVIWTSIIEFLPIPKDLKPEDDKNYAARVSAVTATWETLLNLRLVSKQLAVLLHPREKTLWRRLVRHCFDFSLGESFNIENCHDEQVLEGTEDQYYSDDEEDEGRHKDDADATNREEIEGDAPTEEEDPHAVAMLAHDRFPEDYLEEDLRHWSKIGIYHRPSQYGFLTTLQQQPATGAWPEAEDPFTLFRDIVRLLQLPHGIDMGARGEGCDPTFKYIGAPTAGSPSSCFYRFHVMKTLGYVPHFWRRGRGIGKPWKGFSQPQVMETMITSQLLRDHGRRRDASQVDFEDHDEMMRFPDCKVGDARRLFEHIRMHCRDWRSVCCNAVADGYTPVFFIGESKAAPHRWTGYAGQKCWT